MNLNRERRYVRWFFWSLGIWDEFLEENRERQMEKYGTNLCFFIQTIFVYAPLVLILHAVVYGAAIAAITVVPIYFFGGSRYSWGLGSIAAVILIVIGTKALRDFLNDRARREVGDRFPALKDEREKSASAGKRTPAGPDFLEVIWQWIVAQKKKICPTITFVGQEKEARS